MRKKILITTCVTIVMILAFIASGCSFIKTGSADRDKYDEYIEKAEDYMDDGKYEKAISTYEKALDIISDRDEAYIGIAMAYIEMGDIDSALSILKKGKKAVDDNDDILDLIDDINDGKYDPVVIEPEPSMTVTEPVQTADPVPTEELFDNEIDMSEGYQAYYDLVTDMSDEILFFQDNLLYEGTCDCAALCDITGDGFPELIIAHSDDLYTMTYLINADISIYTYDFTNHETTLMFKFDDAFIQAGGGYETDLVLTDDGRVILFADGGDEGWTYYVKEFIVTGNSLSINNFLEKTEYPDYENNSSIEEFYVNGAVSDEQMYLVMREGFEEMASVTIFLDPVHGYYGQADEFASRLMSLPNNMLDYSELLDELQQNGAV